MGDQPRGRTKGRGSAGRGYPPGQQPPRPVGGRGGPPQQQRPQQAWGPPQQQGPPPQSRGPPLQPPQQAPRPSAWGAPAPQQAPAAPTAWGAPQQAPPTWGPRAPSAPQPQAVRAPVPQESISGRGLHQRGSGEERHPGMEPPLVTAGDVTGGGDNGAQGRGGMRGRREIKAVILKTRPEQIATKQGVGGVPVKLTSNFFELEHLPNWTMYQYRVDFAPDVDMTSTRIGLMRQAMGRELPGYIFDGTILYTPLRLQPEPREVFVDHSELGDADGKVRITLRLRQDVVQYDALNIQIFNLIIRKCLGFLKLQLIRRNYYDPEAKVQIKNFKIEIWPGYETSIKQHEAKVMLNCEVINKFMRIDTALDHLHDLSKNFKVDYKERYQKDLIGCIVITDYNNRTYRIDDVDFSKTPMDTFMKGDTPITYRDYFAMRYKRQVRDMNQPLLVSKTKPREIRAGMPETVYLVPELCRMTGITEAQRNNYQFMQEVANTTRISPDKRIDKLMRFRQRLVSTPEIMEELKRWDLKLADRLVEYQGRTLPPEEIFSARQESYNGGQQANWTAALRGKHMITMGEMKSNGNTGGWLVMCPADQKNTVVSFVQMLQKVSAGMGWNLPPPKRFVHPPDDRPSTLCSSIDQYVRNYQPYFIFATLPYNKQDKYNAIKKKCYVDYAIPSQVVLIKNMASKNAMSIATKVAIQMNCKVGGAPWTVSMPVNHVMIVGFDVCHDGKNKKQKSYGALVATMNKTMTKYFSCTNSHNKGEELSNYMGSGIAMAAKRYAKENGGKLPDRIIIYRDGVGDGQLPFVYDHELKNVQRVLAELYAPNEPPKIAFIVVTKRITTRIFTKTGQNPNPGTIVDDVITQPERYDFFLVSQCVRLGSVMPTSYNILYDTTGWAPGNMQKLTYKLCHMFFNWSGTVRVPAPCQYAHKLAFMASQTLQKSPHPNLDHLLYFL